jgi:hypothetical protein
MKYRIAVWATVGFLVAGFWAVFAFASTIEQVREIWLIVSLTCPISIIGRHHAISLYEALAANTITYALIGLIAETCAGKCIARNNHTLAA